MTKNTMSMHILIDIPSLSKTCEMDVCNSDVIGDVIKQALTSNGILEPKGWHLFLLSNDYIQIDDELTCSYLFLKEIRSLSLISQTTEPVTVYYDGKVGTFANNTSNYLYELLTIVIKAFNLDENEAVYVFLDPSTFSIEALDMPTTLKTLVLKRFSSYSNPFLYQYKTFPVSCITQRIPILSISKIIFLPQLKNLFSALKVARGPINIPKLTETQISNMFNGLLTDSTINTTDGNVQAFLFTILLLQKEPLFTPNLIKLVKMTINVKTPQEVYQNLYSIISMLPMTSHLLINELSIIYNNVLSSQNQSERDSITQLLTFVFFRENGLERFTRLLLLLSPWVLRLPGRLTRDLGIYNNKFIVAERGKPGYGEDGPLDIGVTNQFTPPPVDELLAAAIESLLPPPPPDLHGPLTALNRATEELTEARQNGAERLQFAREMLSM